MVEKCLEEIVDNGLVDIAKVDAIYAQIDTGYVGEVEGVIVILVHSNQPHARERTLQWFCGVEEDVELLCTVFERPVDHGGNIQPVVFAVEK